MATLTIRNLDDKVHAALRVRAAQHGRSMEEEARQALSEAVGAATAPPDPDAAAAKLRELVRAANNGRYPSDSVDQFIAERRLEAAREELDACEQIAEHMRRSAAQ